MTQLDTVTIAMSALKQAVSAATRQHVRHTLTGLLTVVVMMFHGGVFAKDYLIEVVLFENLNSGPPTSNAQLLYPRITSALGLASDSAAAAGFELVEDGLSLTENADSISASSRYRLLKHFAWRQPGLERRDAKAIRINVGRASTVYLPEDLTPYKNVIPASAQPGPDRTREVRTTTVNGTIKVRLGRFLHMETELVFTDEEARRSYTLSQSRKMRSRELHYIDNPRFGVLTRILPIEDAAN